MPAGIDPAGRLKKTCHDQIYATKKHTCSREVEPAGRSPAGFLKRLQISVHATKHDNHDACWYRTC